MGACVGRWRLRLSLRSPRRPQSRPQHSDLSLCCDLQVSSFDVPEGVGHCHLVTNSGDVTSLLPLPFDQSQFALELLSAPSVSKDVSYRDVNWFPEAKPDPIRASVGLTVMRLRVYVLRMGNRHVVELEGLLNLRTDLKLQTANGGS